MLRAVEGPTLRPSLFPKRGLRVHMIGIGGSGMCGAAEVLLRHGAVVSGSDLSTFDGMGRLTAAGATVYIGHRVEQVADGIELVAMSAAVRETNPELALARARGIEVVKYAELVGRLMQHYSGVAVAGTHGKSTTTALTAFLFREAGLDPSFVVGGSCDQLGGSSAAGSGTHFVVEACEFDRSFLNFHPDSAAVLNVEPDHLDCYADLDEIVDAFRAFGRQISPTGLMVFNADDVGAQRACAAIGVQAESFGFGDDADWRATNLRVDGGRYRFDVLRHGRHYLTTSLAIAGRHNVANSLAAIALAHRAGADARAVAEAMPKFTGVKRRMTYRGQPAGVVIVDDYAHHPTEIRVTIQAVRDQYQPKRAWVIFQPHQHSRTCHFMDDFAASFSLADEIIVPDIYGARESNEADRKSGAQELVSRICKRGGRARYLPLEDVTDHLTRHVVDGDMVLTMGAGDVWKVADELVRRIR